MPFRETNPVAERIALFHEVDSGLNTVAELCRRHGLSRTTFYAWKARRDAGEERWYVDRSHAVARSSHATDAAKVEAIVASRRRDPTFRPQKIRAALARTPAITAVPPSRPTPRRSRPWTSQKWHRRRRGRAWLMAPA
jgi:transposase-like protein